MVSSTTIVGLVFLLTGGGLLALLREPIRQPEKPASRWFALSVVGIALWPISLGASYLLSDLALSIAAWNLRAVAAAIISVGWLLLAVEYTTRRTPSRLLLGALSAYVVLDVVVTWTNPAHHLLLTEATAQSGTVLVPVFGPWFWFRTVVNYGLIFLATALLAVEWNGASGIQRRQAGILTVAVVPPVAANLLTLSSSIPSIYDLTPFGLAGSGLLLTWALYRVEFLDVVPVAREAAMEEMRDAVVTLDAEDRVVDCNEAARDLFGADDGYVGTPAEEFLASVPGGMLEEYIDAVDVESRVSVETETGPRHYSLSISPISVDEDVRGRVVVLRDVTPLVAREQALEQRQQELDLLRQVLTRVLRHNLRNALTTIRGTAESLAADLDGEEATQARRIGAASEDLLAISEKAGHVERIATDDDPITYDLAAVAADVVADCRGRYPAVGFELDVPPECPVEAGRGLEAAIEALVENAADYSDPEGGHVTVTVDESDPSIRIVDDGSGIPEAEVAVLEAREETQLEHGSGIGLWIAKWVSDRAGATLSFDASAAGTTVTMDFGAARSRVSRYPTAGTGEDSGHYTPFDP